MSTVTRPSLAADVDYKVADLSLHEFGRHEIRLAEHEMPGLMATRREFADAAPLKGARITGSLHMTIQSWVPTGLRTIPGACPCSLGRVSRWPSTGGAPSRR
jgi:adenosylhomocysteinase